MADMKIWEWAKFGAIGGVVLAVLSSILGFLVGKTATIQFALIKDPLVAQVGIPSASGFGTKLIGAITMGIGWGVPTFITKILVIVAGGAIAAIIGRIAYVLVHEMLLKNKFPKSKMGKVAAVLFHAGLFGGILISWFTVLPTIGTAITLALSALVTAWVLIWLSNRKSLEKYVKIPSI